VPRAWTDGELCTDRTRVHVYTYRYERPSLDTRAPGKDLMVLCDNPGRGAAGVYHAADTRSAVLPLGRMMVIPASAVISATGPGGDRQLSVCSTAAGLLPPDFDPTDARQIALCGDVRDVRVRATMERLAAEAVAPGFAADLLVDARAASLSVDLARYFHRSRAAASVAGQGRLAAWQLRRVEDLVAGSVGKRLTVADLAAAAEVSPSHFARSFRASTGRTVHRFVEEARLARAQAMLRETNLPLKQVAAALGFSGPSSFTLAFRRATGTTPARYRAEAPPC
jgi:AraC family transcriptional regulator